MVSEMHGQQWLLSDFQNSDTRFLKCQKFCKLVSSNTNCEKCNLFTVTAIAVMKMRMRKRWRNLSLRKVRSSGPKGSINVIQKREMFPNQTTTAVPMSLVTTRILVMVSSDYIKIIENMSSF